MTGGGGNVKARDTQAFREDEPLPSTARPHTTNVVSVRPLSNARQGISRRKVYRSATSWWTFSSRAC